MTFNSVFKKMLFKVPSMSSDKDELVFSINKDPLTTTGYCILSLDHFDPVPLDMMAKIIHDSRLEAYHRLTHWKPLMLPALLSFPFSCQDVVNQLCDWLFVVALPVFWCQTYRLDLSHRLTEVEGSQGHGQKGKEPPTYLPLIAAKVDSELESV